MEAEILEAEALKLPEYERALLVDHLQQSLSGGTIQYLDEHLEESKARFEAYKSGAVIALDGDTAVSSIRARLQK
ncbi:addiction module protein [bacterium]|nr:addiction module protein [bacterium]